MSESSSGAGGGTPQDPGSSPGPEPGSEPGQPPASQPPPVQPPSAPASPSGPVWGESSAQPPAAPAGPGWGEPAAPAGPAWGQPAAPTGPAWGQPPAQPAQPAAPAWGQPPAPPPAQPPVEGTPPPAAPPSPAAEPPPTFAAAVPPPPAAGWAGGAAPPPSQATGLSGCAKALIIVFVLGVVAVLLFVFVIGNILNNFARDLGIDGDGNGGGIGADCAFLSDADARAVFGGNADAAELTGLADVSIGLILDKRVLANAPDCWVTDGAKAYIARIAVYRGGDAATVYAAEHKSAEPTSQDQGGGVTLENPGYLGEEVSGLGDSAFCTDISPAIMAGVVVLQGDRVVYVSVGSANEEQPTIDGSELCGFAQEVARVVLR